METPDKNKKVETKEDLENNIFRVEQYLQEPKSSPDRKEMIRLIKDGNNFIKYKVGNEYHFVPSKYIGYKDNTIEKHRVNLGSRNGGDTDKAINKILIDGSHPETKIDDENLYRIFCESLSAKVSNVDKDFWHFDDITSKIENCELSGDFQLGGFREGHQKEVTHKRRERSFKLVQAVKEKYKNNLICCICGFDFKHKYGELGDGFIEVHHTKPISEMSENEETKIEDMVIVCSNCHRMLHRKRPWLTISELKTILK